MIERHHTNARMSMIVTYPLSGQMIRLAGLVADNRSADVAGQTAEILGKIDGFLAEAGVTRAEIVSAWIWLADMATFEQMNAVWDAWVPPGHGPVRACVGAALAQPDILVEIQVQAVKAG